MAAHCRRGIGDPFVVSHRNAVLLSAAFLSAAMFVGGRAAAQSLQGSWSDTFHHSTVAPAGTDFAAPFRGPGFVPPPASGVFSWGFYTSGGGAFQPVHMALIPKGPHQGKLLVWDEWPVVLRASSALDPTNRFWSCQAWAIVDPEPRLPRFRNFLLPSVPFGPKDGSSYTVSGAPFDSIVCAGHAWSQEGDLIVAGGEMGDIDALTNPPLINNFEITKTLVMFDPVAASQPFGLSCSLYPGEIGAWKKPGNQELLVGRWYPTVTLSQRITRNGLNNEVVVVAGGADFATNQVLNTYESFVVRASNSPAGFLTRDPDHGPTTQVMPGPGGTLNFNFREMLGLYPRLHLLSTGDLFVSGYGPDSSAFSMNAPLASRTWNRSVGRFGSVWNASRENGGSVFFARMAGGALQDVVVRLGGWNTSFLPTSDAEACLASSGTAPWITLPPMPGNSPGTVGRTDLNPIILPDSTLLVIGGSALSTSPPGYVPVLQPALYVPSTNTWHLQPAETTLSPRRYHSTAALLPDGRVLVGGGNDRTTGAHPDYAIFSPHYLQGNPPPLRPRIVSITGPAGAVTIDPLDGTYVLDGQDVDTGLPVVFQMTCTDLDPNDAVVRLVLLAPAAMTHHSDMTARYVELPSNVVSSTRRNFLTMDGNRLPRGYYMAFALNRANIPSKAVWVKIRS